MATINDWNAYMNVVQELALVEDDLREIAGLEGFDIGGVAVAQRILFERFGVGDSL